MMNNPVKPLRCASTDYNRDECRQPAEHECIDCGRGVCIRCTDPCFTCGFHLHTDCRDEHAKEAGHPVDPPKKPGNRIDRIIAEETAEVEKLIHLVVLAFVIGRLGR